MKLKNSKPPFSINPDATTEVILSRLNEAKLSLEDGNWKQISSEAKVSSENYFFYSKTFELLYNHSGSHQENVKFRSKKSN